MFHEPENAEGEERDAAGQVRTVLNTAGLPTLISVLPDELLLTNPSVTMLIRGRTPDGLDSAMQVSSPSGIPRRTL